MSDVTEYLASYLPSLLDALAGSDVRELELQDGDTRIRLHRVLSAGAQTEPAIEEPQPGAEEIDLSTHPITSPLVGTFYRASKPGMDPFVSEDSLVEEGTVVGIVESLHVFTDIEAGCRGVVTEAHAVDGQPVEYGQVLFTVRRRD